MASQYVGVCYGQDDKNPENVIKLFNSNNIKRMRIYKPNPGVMQALGGSVIVLIFGVPNEEIPGLANNNEAATTWVKNNVEIYSTYVNFSCIAVGNGVQPSDVVAPFVFSAMQNILNALTSFGLQNQVKVSTAIDARLLGDFHLPSQASFSDETRKYIEPILGFLARTKAPLLANVHPYFAYIKNSKTFTLSFALFTSQDFIYDGNLAYKNLFDFLLDGIYCAMEKLGVQSLDIVASESGWPGKGGPEASVLNANVYYRNLIDHVMNGTPKKPKQPIETHLYSMFDGDEKANDIDQHFGLFYPNEEPKYTAIFPLK